jgi:hypothetical protein
VELLLRRNPFIGNNARQLQFHIFKATLFTRWLYFLLLQSQYACNTLHLSPQEAARLLRRFDKSKQNKNDNKSQTLIL